MKFNKFATDRLVIWTVVLAILFGLTAGIVGQLVTATYLRSADQGYAVGLSQPTVPELRHVKNFLGGDQDFQINQAVQKIKPTVAGFYNKKTASAAAVGQLYAPADLLANGFVLTSDGWVVSYNNSLTTKVAGLLAAVNGKFYTVDLLLRDPLTGVLFIKINATNLPVASLGDSVDLASGQLVTSVNNLSEVAVAYVKNDNFFNAQFGADYLASSEKFNHTIVLSMDLPKSYLGSPLIILNGDVVGVVSQTTVGTSVVPINQFYSLVASVLKNHVIQRSALGLTYLDLTKVMGIAEDLTQGQTRGALVYQAPLRSTPAGVAGVLKNDIIVKINDQSLDRDHSLTDLVQQYQPGAKITMEILRAGKALTVEVVLASLLQ